jgi:DNA-binding CsgD family transcriptional regulator
VREWSDPDKREAALQRIARRLARADPLTTEELALVFLASHGVPRGVSGEWLNLAPSTVTRYLHRARMKLYAATTEHAVATALRLGLIS